MKDNLFGTDGIRSAAGVYPLDKASLIELGAVIASLSPHRRVLIGRDTRESGPDIENQLCRGLGQSTTIFSAGVIPTPGLAFLTRKMDFDFGIMVSASHNPFADNGIKIFDNRGEKISESFEKKICAGFLAKKKATPGRPQPAAAMTLGPYADFLYENGHGLAPSSPTVRANRGLKIALDCANGSAARLAAPLCRRLGLDAVIGFARPDGRNINCRCGSTFPAALQKRVIQNKAHLGMAFDGDADRVIFCDRAGHLLEGDHTLYLLARYLLATEPRFNRRVVGTVMGNLGLEKALNALGIEFLRAGVGDKHVYRLMKRSGAILGGEPSGHIILRQQQTTGDGFLTAIFFLKALQFFRCDAAEVREQLPLFPQQTLSIRVRRKKDLKSWKTLQQASREFQRRFGAQARLLVRYSGTEPKLRIMMEARDAGIIQKNMAIFHRLVENENGE